MLCAGLGGEPGRCRVSRLACPGRLSLKAGAGLKAYMERIPVPHPTSSTILSLKMCLFCNMAFMYDLVRTSSFCSGATALSARACLGGRGWGSEMFLYTPTFPHGCLRRRVGGEGGAVVSRRGATKASEEYISHHGGCSWSAGRRGVSTSIAMRGREARHTCLLK